MKPIRRKYTPEFKAAAIARIPKEGVSAVARDIGVYRSMLNYWRVKAKNPESQLAMTVAPVLPLVKAAKPYKRVSLSIRAKAIARVHAGESQTAVAKDIGVHGSTLCSWVKAAPKEAKALPTVQAPAPSINYCPHCGFPIAPVIKAVAAIHALAR